MKKNQRLLLWTLSPIKGSQKGSPLIAPTRAEVWRGGIPLAVRNLTSCVASPLGCEREKGRGRQRVREKRREEEERRKG